MKIRACYAAHNVDTNIFRKSINSIYNYVDEVYIIWGRFLHYNGPYYDPPDWLKGLDKVHLIIEDKKNIQHIQRSMYLQGLEENDIFIYIDSDEVFCINEEPWTDMVNRYDWDGYTVTLYTIDGEFEQMCIRVFRYHKHMYIGPGQLPYLAGEIVAGGGFNIKKSDFITAVHHRADVNGYRQFQKQMWKDESTYVNGPVTDG